jgi:hypothetical protein
MPLQQISGDLGVTPQQFEQCMKSGKPATGGEIDKGIVVQCLQKINSSITADQLKATMMKYRSNNAGNNNPSKPAQEISADLGVTPQQFTQCMKNGKPAQEGGEIDKVVVVQCLQKINPSITMDQLKSSIMKYRPKPGGTPTQN